MAIQQFYNSPWLTGIRPNDAKNNTSAFAAPDPWRLMQLGNQSNMNEAYAGGYNSWTNPQPQPKQQQTNPIMQAYLQGKSPQGTPQGTPQEGMMSMQAQNGLVIDTGQDPYPAYQPPTDWYIPPWMRVSNVQQQQEMMDLYSQLYDQYGGTDLMAGREADWQKRYDEQRKYDFNAALQYLSALTAQQRGITDPNWDTADPNQRLKWMQAYAAANPTFDPFTEVARIQGGRNVIDPVTGNPINPNLTIWESDRMKSNKGFNKNDDIAAIAKYLSGSTNTISPELLDIVNGMRSALTGQSDDMIQFAKGLSPESYSGFRRMYGPMTGREMNIQQYLSLLPSEKQAIEGDWDEWGYNAEDEWAKLLAAAPKGEANPYQRYMSWQ